ncbi:hypothetical protein EJB05_35898 [Eragrostis curvula]|uniref:Serine-threonine/tyrosine-protein kinase catalytic domain-containing protein n=1 Tax=Eragrostis curvula TaxID=38414 RepID=A0A5J9U7P5_9POAL|nr:hypothetical protein EJB05_35898 [Eragrostis curvula]
MSCFPCFKKKNEQAEAEPAGQFQPGPGNNMTPPDPVHAPPAYASAAAPAAPANDAKRPGDSADEASLRGAISARAFAFRELAAATDHFTPYNLVGEGGFFRVYKGQLEKNGQALPMFKDQKRYHELVDPLIKKEYPAKALNQVVAMAAMCLQEEDSVRPLMADVVMTLGFLTTMPPDPPASAAPPAAAPEPNKKEKKSDHSDSSSSSSSDDEGNEEEEEEEEEEAEEQ